MRLPFNCSRCFSERSTPTPWIFVEYQDSNLYRYTCPNGHENATIVKQQKLETLFTIGMHAILDGYYREAVASFAASLERFYEFFIRVKLANDEIDPTTFNNSWKHVSAQSERQLGAFILLYTQEYREVPILLSQTNVKFRNNVIHKGTIPCKTEAMEFGQSVLDIINPIAEKMSINLSESILNITYQDIKKHEEELLKSKEAPYLSHFNGPSLLNVSMRHPDHTPTTLAAGLEHMEKLRAAKNDY